MRWAEHEGLDEEDTESLIDLIERLDLKEHELVDADAKRKAKRDGADSEARD